MSTLFAEMHNTLGQFTVNEAGEEPMDLESTDNTKSSRNLNV